MSISKQLRRVSIVVLLMFTALFVSTSVIQVVSADELRDDPRNSRTFYANASVNRGPILVDGEAVAYSVPTGETIAYQRVYENGPLYAPVTGYYTIGQGNTGLEAEMNDVLTGASGGQFFDQVRAVLTGQKPQGAAVETTIDPVVQQAMWDALGDYMGAAIAIEPDTGRILGMVSKPSYDPNVLANHDTEAVIDAYAQLIDDPGDPLINRTMNGDLDPPGSTFKLVTAAAALETGKYTPDSAFPNPSALMLPQSSSVIHNWNYQTCGGGETATIADAIRLSCNIPMAELGRELTYRTIREQALKFGFDASVDVPMASTPSIYPRVLDDAQTMLSAFGQSDVRASPLQMAMVGMAIANGGKIMQPTLVDAVVAPDQSTLSSFEPSVYSEAISARTATQLTAMMEASVVDGAASTAAIDGVRVAGKTGTAENGDDPYSFWFVGFAPVEDPEVVVAVVIQDGAGLGQDGTSSGTSAPVGRQMIEAVISR